MQSCNSNVLHSNLLPPTLDLTIKKKKKKKKSAIKAACVSCVVADLENLKMIYFSFRT